MTKGSRCRGHGPFKEVKVIPSLNSKRNGGMCAMRLEREMGTRACAEALDFIMRAMRSHWKPLMPWMTWSGVYCLQVTLATQQGMDQRESRLDRLGEQLGGYFYNPGRSWWGPQWSRWQWQRWKDSRALRRQDDRTWRVIGCEGWAAEAGLEDAP